MVLVVAVRSPGVPLSRLIPLVAALTKVWVLTPTGCACIIAPLPLDAAPTLTERVSASITVIGKFTEPPQCMPDEYKDTDYVTAYRRYYNTDKKYFAKWEKGRGCPEWWIQ